MVLGQSKECHVSKGVNHRLAIWQLNTCVRPEESIHSGTFEITEAYMGLAIRASLLRGPRNVNGHLAFGSQVGDLTWVSGHAEAFGHQANWPGHTPVPVGQLTDPVSEV